MFRFAKLDKAPVFFHVKNMTTEGAASAVIHAVHSLDAEATIKVDLPMRRVEIDPKVAEPSAIRDAICGAGFSALRQWPSERAYLWQ